MKNLSAILVSALFTCLLFTAVLYSSCDPGNKCDDITCQNGGSCKDGACQCPTGYEGELCEIKSDLCKGVTCLNDGTCKDGSCLCAPGFSGPRCENDICATKICLNGATCKNGHCQCAWGYEGDSCQTMTRTKFLGTWSGTGTGCGGGAITILITKDNNVGVIVKYTSDEVSFTTSPAPVGNKLVMTGQQHGSQLLEFGMTVNGQTADFYYTLHDPATNITAICKGKASK